MSWIQVGVIAVLLLGVACLLLSIEAKLGRVVDCLQLIERQLVQTRESIPREPLKVQRESPELMDVSRNLP